MESLKSNTQEYERLLKNERDFLSYLHMLRKGEGYVIIITVADTGAAQYFTQECAQAMMDLGLEINMFNRYRSPYIAVIDCGNVVCEKSSDDLEKPLIINGQLNNHDLVIYSAGFMCMTGIGCGTMILIDGADYSAGGRGFNFFIFDSVNERIVDSCFFDTFDMATCQHRNNPSESALLSFQKLYPDVSLCVLLHPRCVPKYNKDVSLYENWLRQKSKDNPGWMFDLLRSKKEWKSIYEQKRLPFCSDYDSFDDFFEAFTTPQSYLNLEGVRRFRDYKSNAVNTKDGIRVTIGQPKHPKRAIFIIGMCGLYGWGATDEHTPASLLQKNLNVYAEDKDFIVYNYSGFFGTDGRIAERLAILRTLPLRKGDIVFLSHLHPG